MMQRLTRSALSVLALALVLAGCTHQPEGPQVDAQQVRDDMVEFVSATKTTAGGTWTALSARPASSACTTDSGESGVTFSWDQERDGADDPETLVRNVAADWKKRGYEVTLRKSAIDDGRPLWSAVSSGQAVESISVNASARRVSIEVQSNCGTGDAADWE